MGAVAKNPIPQLMPPAAHRSARLFIPDPAAPARAIGTEYAERLSQFVPVIVLVPSTSADSRGSGGEPAKHFVDRQRRNRAASPAPRRHRTAVQGQRQRKAASVSAM